MTVAELRERIDLVDLVGRTEPLRQAGRKFRGVEHESLWVDPDRGLWTRFSQGGEAGQKYQGGDAFGWLALARFGHTKVAGADFMEVVRDACEVAGVDFDAEFGREDFARAAQERRHREDTLGAYADLAARSWTGEARQRFREIKPWATDEVIDRWRLGVAPTIEEMAGAGLARADLLRAGLVAERERDDGTAVHAAFFWDCVVIPVFERGAVVHLTSRRLVAAPEKGPKCKHLAGPRPAGFNLDVLRDKRVEEVGVMLVEGALDAIACTERGHPAVALFGISVGDDLVRKLRGRS